MDGAAARGRRADSLFGGRGYASKGLTLRNPPVPYARLPFLVGVDALDRPIAVRIGLVDAHDLLGLVAVVPGARTGHGGALLGFGQLLALILVAGLHVVVGAHRRLLSRAGGC